ncbi:MAG: deoxyribodipyrimidine photo-lyase, partial [Bryocella sp.]
MNNPLQLTSVQQKDADYARLGEVFLADPATPAALRELAEDLRVTIRRAGQPAPNGKCVVYWMQRAQRARDNHALDKAIDLANALGLPCVVYFAAVSNFPHANLRHYTFLHQGLPEIEDECAARGVGFVLRRARPDTRPAGKPGHEDPLRFFADVEAALVVGDENPTRATEQWRVRITTALRIPFWTVDTDVIVPSKLLEKAQFSAGVA